MVRQASKSITNQAAPSIAFQPRVDFQNEAIEKLIQQKGYDCFIEKGFQCPCHSKESTQRSGCKNCGGSGWVFINKIKTRLILTSMNLPTKMKDWSAENKGTVSVTGRDVDHLSFMDRITVIDVNAVYKELLFPKDNGANFLAYTLYDMKSVNDVFLFTDVDEPLARLEETTHYTISDNKVILESSLFDGIDEPCISISYVHSPQYLTMDIPREVMNTFVLDRVTGNEQSVKMPIHAIAVRSHYVLDSENFAGDRLFDNSYEL